MIGGLAIGRSSLRGKGCASKQELQGCLYIVRSMQSLQQREYLTSTNLAYQKEELICEWQNSQSCLGCLESIIFVQHK